MVKNLCRTSVTIAAMLAIVPVAARGADDASALRSEIDQLRQELRDLRGLVQSQTMRSKGEATVNPTESTVLPPDWNVNSIAHLSGYGAVGYTDQRNASASFSTASFNPIFHFQYKDILLFQSELETSVQPDGSTELALEYASINFFVNDNLSLFGGKFLTPVGYFFQNLHPAWINKFPSKPPGFGGEGSAAPESDVGVGVRGGLILSDVARANYAFYVGNGPRLELNGAGDEIEAIEAEGATSNTSGRKFIGGRVGVLPIPGLVLGLSGGVAKAAVSGEGKRSYSVAGADMSFKRGAFDWHAEYIQQRVGDLASSVAPDGGTWKTWYTQLAYRVPSTNWEPVVRFGDFKSPHADQRRRQWGLGANYWLASSAVAKFAYEFNKGETGTVNDDNRLMIQFGFGF